MRKYAEIFCWKNVSSFCSLLIFFQQKISEYNGVVYLVPPGHPADIGLQLGKVCYVCSRYG